MPTANCQSLIAKRRSHTESWELRLTRDLGPSSTTSTVHVRHGKRAPIMNPDVWQAPQFVLPPLPELRSTSVFGRRICYYDIGSGPVLELLGFGRSDKPPIKYRIGGFVEVLERFLHTLRIERASLLGHSLGGWIVAAFALQFPHRVDKLVLNDAAGIDAGGIQ